MFPGDEHEGAVQSGGFEAFGKGAPVGDADIGLDGHGEGDGGGFDGGQRADVIVGSAVIGFGVGGVGGENQGGFAKIAADDGGKGQGAVEALAVELAEAVRRFFGVAQEDDGFDCGRRGGVGRGRGGR